MSRCLTSMLNYMKLYFKENPLRNIHNRDYVTCDMPYVKMLFVIFPGYLEKQKFLKMFFLSTHSSNLTLLISSKKMHKIVKLCQLSH